MQMYGVTQLQMTNIVRIEFGFQLKYLIIYDNVDVLYKYLIDMCNNTCISSRKC